MTVILSREREGGVIKVQYIPQIVHSVRVLLRFVVVKYRLTIATAPVANNPRLT